MLSTAEAAHKAQIFINEFVSWEELSDQVSADYDRFDLEKHEHAWVAPFHPDVIKVEGRLLVDTGRLAVRTAVTVPRLLNSRRAIHRTTGLKPNETDYLELAQTIIDNYEG